MIHILHRVEPLLLRRAPLHADDPAIDVQHSSVISAHRTCSWRSTRATHCCAVYALDGLLLYRGDSYCIRMLEVGMNACIIRRIPGLSTVSRLWSGLDRVRVRISLVCPKPTHGLGLRCHRTAPEWARAPSTSIFAIVSLRREELFELATAWWLSTQNGSSYTAKPHPSRRAGPRSAATRFGVGVRHRHAPAGLTRLSCYTTTEIHYLFTRNRREFNLGVVCVLDRDAIGLYAYMTTYASSATLRQRTREISPYFSQDPVAIARLPRAARGSAATASRSSMRSIQVPVGSLSLRESVASFLSCLFQGRSPARRQGRDFIFTCGLVFDGIGLYHTSMAHSRLLWRAHEGNLPPSTRPTSSPSAACAARSPSKSRRAGMASCSPSELIPPSCYVTIRTGVQPPGIPARHGVPRVRVCHRCTRTICACARTAFLAADSNLRIRKSASHTPA
ncbi:hypothetical protein C8R47DRAFT_1319146 [Mycena vitilis]|nr:hypothetical protein C8R47DRAFT_1319146 [Mycena vitilis]